MYWNCSACPGWASPNRMVAWKASVANSLVLSVQRVKVWWIISSFYIEEDVTGFSFAVCKIMLSSANMRSEMNSSCPNLTQADQQSLSTWLHRSHYWAMREMESRFCSCRSMRGAFWTFLHEDKKDCGILSMPSCCRRRLSPLACCPERLHSEGQCGHYKANKWGEDLLSTPAVSLSNYSRMLVTTASSRHESGLSGELLFSESLAGDPAPSAQWARGWWFLNSDCLPWMETRGFSLGTEGQATWQRNFVLGVYS